MSKSLQSLTQIEQINFLITNRIPRHLVTRFMGWFSKIENPRLAKLSIRIWQQFANDLDLTESETQNFRSLHQCFVRKLKANARAIDQAKHIIASPCDAIVGSCGRINYNEILQAKGFPYTIDELVGSPDISPKCKNGIYVTLRLKSTMYHRFHAPVDCQINGVTYISGDTWNVNPIALKRIERLYCKNERAVLELETQRPDQFLALVPVAAILVASMKFHCLPDVLDLKYKGPNYIPCKHRYKKGDEMGYFQHGSTIILLASSEHALVPGIVEGQRIQMGQALLSIPSV